MSEQTMTREEIVAWLKQQPETRTMGDQTDYSCNCLVACYLRDQGYDDADVGCGEVWLDGDRSQEGKKMSDAVTALVSIFDNIPGYDHTPSEVLRAIEEED